MNKYNNVLEIVDKMANYILLDEEYGFIDDEEKQSIIKDRETIKQAVLELKVIKESKPSEALEGLKIPLHNEWLRFYPQFKEIDESTKIVDGCRMVKSDADNYLTIKQALLKASENEIKAKAFDEIKDIVNMILVYGDHAIINDKICQVINKTLERIEND